MKKKSTKPVINDANDREKNIKENKPAIFEIKKNPDQNFGLKFWDNLRTFDSLGKKTVRDYDKPIQNFSKKYKIDPDVVRAVMYAENARGHRVFINKVWDDIGVSESPLPMNIQKTRWSSLIDKKPEDMYDHDANIEAATILISRIRDRLEKPSVEKIGSIWHYLGAEKTDEFGEYVGRIYREKPWQKLE